MADAQITGQRGTTIGYRFTVTLDGADFDLTVPGTVVTFTAKRRRSDTAALITITYRALPLASDAGITLVTGKTDQLDLQIPPAATADFTKTEFLVWDAVLTENGGRETAIAKGGLTVRAGVGT